MASRQGGVRIAGITAGFEQLYGRNDSRLDNWQRLCRDVSVAEGTSITQCKKNLKRVYINIVDFVEAQQAGRQVHVFRSYKALQNYIQNNKNKRYPLGAAKQNPILRHMLVHVY